MGILILILTIINGKWEMGNGKCSKAIINIIDVCKASNNIINIGCDRNFDYYYLSLFSFEVRLSQTLVCKKICRPNNLTLAWLGIHTR